MGSEYTDSRQSSVAESAYAWVVTAAQTEAYLGWPLHTGSGSVPRRFSSLVS